MKCTKRGVKFREIWKGHCSICGSEFEAERCELEVKHNAIDKIEYAHESCPVCDAPAGLAVILYPHQIEEVT